MFEEKVSRELAEKEVQGWLDGKRVSPKKRESYKDAIENLIDGVVYGDVTISDERKIVHLLKFPINDSEGNPAVSKLEYKPRLTVADTEERMKGLKPGDSNGRIRATVSALTGVAVGLLRKMDTEDDTIAQSVAVFFL